MHEWKLKTYAGREIKTEEDIMWVCAQLMEAERTGQMSFREIGALAYIRQLHQKHIDEGRFGHIENRFEILDL